MTIKLDENLPERLALALSTVGHDVDTVRAEQLAGRDDADVWRAAQAAGRFLITQDLDFSDVRRYTPGTHVGLLLVRLAKPGRDALSLRPYDSRTWPSLPPRRLRHHIADRDRDRDGGAVGPLLHDDVTTALANR